MSEACYDWVKEPDKEDIIEMLETSQPIYFQFQGKDYLLEMYQEGVLIADPIPYYDNGGYPNNPKYQYPMSFKAKTVEEMLGLPFLAGKTLFEAWDSIKFWNY
jgi:hypothetical protein